MSSEGDLLPLFPLQVVLFPGSEMPLHIFEPRYRRMVGEAAEEGSEFGIVAAQGQTIEVVGCTAIPEEVTHRYDDGRFDVRIRGVRRFRTEQLEQSDEVLRATVDYFDDEPGLPIEASEVEKLYRLAVEAAGLAGVKIASVPAADDPTPSFRAAEILPLELQFKQQLVTSRSERQRIAKLTAHLEAWISQQKKKERAAALSRRNGKAH